MKIAFATHALRGYPPHTGGIPTLQTRQNFFKWVKHKGFDGIEVGDWWFDFYTAEVSQIETLKREMSEHGLELAGFNCLRKCVTHPAVKEKNKKDLKRVVEIAKTVQPKAISISLSLEPSVSNTPEDRLKGLAISPGGSEGVGIEHFQEAAQFLAELADEAEKAQVGIAIELHHCSIADTSQSLLKILSLADHSNLSANPDLGNLYWAYDKPKEPWYEAVEKLAGRVDFWHVKNINRIYIPEIERSFFVHAALDAGDIDYRWALEKFVSSGFDGYISIEGAGPGDLLAFVARGKAYLDELITDLAIGIGSIVEKE